MASLEKKMAPAPGSPAHTPIETMAEGGEWIDISGDGGLLKKVRWLLVDTCAAVVEQNGKGGLDFDAARPPTLQAHTSHTQ
jgi:hypothetical protein